MTEDLQLWDPLENGLPLRGRKKFKIIGIIGDLNVIVQLSGQLMVWRKLDWIERVQGRYGVSFRLKYPLELHFKNEKECAKNHIIYNLELCRNSISPMPNAIYLQ